ncbi:MAG: FAD-dependent oxidoreductase, partial [Phycisphaerales bacterium]|nr:FAD-dependent oxidoreductase [Phycisphaerales bacterium]
GIAGLAASLRLAEAGVRVTLLETRRKLGGRATSFQDVRSGETLDNCQHVAMQCCVNYLDFLRSLGAEDKLRWTDTTYWVEKGGRVSVLRPGLTPPPGHMAASFALAKFLTAGEKAAIARAMIAMLRLRGRHSERGATFADWLARRRQPRSVIDKFWSPIVVSACNLPVERVDAACALHVFLDGFLATRACSRMAVAAVPLVDLYDPAESILRTAGGEIRLGVSVDRLDARSVTTATGETLEADAVVCAVTPERAAKIIDPAVFPSDPRFAALERFTFSPILGVHLLFDRQAIDLPHAVLVNRPTQWVFNKSLAVGGTPAPAQRLHAVVSAADEWLDFTEEQVAERVLADIHACFPSSRAAKLLSARPVKEKRATFAATPEIEALRPAQAGPSAIYLAGDYTHTGWPATMEGAARSGYLAAAAALGQSPDRALVPDPIPGPLVRLLSHL